MNSQSNTYRPVSTTFLVMMLVSVPMTATPQVIAAEGEDDWIVAPEAARELIEAGALVIDARDVSLRRRQGAVPNAVPLAWEELSQSREPFRGRLIDDDAQLSQKLQGLGVTGNRPIVVIADPTNGWGEDGRVAWALRTLGHPMTVIADGGVAALRRLGEFRIRPAQAPGDFVVTRTERWEVDKEELRTRLQQQNVVVFDVREQREFQGSTPYGESRGGHVPGAKWLWYKDLIGQDGRILPQVEVERLLAESGVSKDSEIVAYCTGGIRSAWFTAVLSDFGYRVRNYAGSMWEWSASPSSEYPLTRGN